MFSNRTKSIINIQYIEGTGRYSDYSVAIRAPVGPPSHLPDPERILNFDVEKKKHDIFEIARERIKSKAQYTKSGRKPWTQITVTLPVKPGTTDEEDQAVVWALMRESCPEVEDDGNGDLTWTIWNNDGFLKWLNIDTKSTKPVNKYVHPVMYETGARKGTLLQNKLKKAKKNGNFYEVQRLETQLEEYESAQASKATASPSGNDYHWSCYDQCNVTYKKKQTRKSVNELQLIVKIRTCYLGCGDPKENNGYLGGGGSVNDLDPKSEYYQMRKKFGY